MQSNTKYEGRHRNVEIRHLDVQDIAIRIGFTILTGFLLVYFILMGMIVLP